jgi:tetratricopeptide (TPR) repeat protein
MAPKFSPPQPRGPSQSELALQQAAFAVQSGRPAEAERIANEVLAHNAGDVRAMHMLGYALLVQKRGKEAVGPLERAARQTRDPAIETQFAMALRQAGRDEEALTQFERAIKRKPPFPPAFLELSHLLSELGRHDEAIERLQQGLAVAPDFADLSYQLGRLYSMSGRDADARNVFARTVALAPRHLDALFALARSFQAERDFAQAAETYRRILAVAPKDAAAQIGLGVCLIELGQSEEALVHLRAASRAGEKAFGETINALVDAGRGRFWLRPSDAVRALRGEKT